MAQLSPSKMKADKDGGCSAQRIRTCIYGSTVSTDGNKG